MPTTEIKTSAGTLPPDSARVYSANPKFRTQSFGDLDSHIVGDLVLSALDLPLTLS